MLSVLYSYACAIGRSTSLHQRLSPSISKLNVTLHSTPNRLDKVKIQSARRSSDELIFLIFKIVFNSCGSVYSRVILYKLKVHSFRNRFHKMHDLWKNMLAIASYCHFPPFNFSKQQGVYRSFSKRASKHLRIFFLKSICCAGFCQFLIHLHCLIIFEDVIFYKLS